MGLRHVAGSFVILSGLLAACGKPAQPPASAATVPGAPLSVVPPLDLTPVPVPKDLVVMARAERLDSAAATIARWLNLPFDMKMLDALGPGLSRTLRTDMPVEAAVVMVEGGDSDFAQPYAVFSVGVTSLEAARQLFEKFGRKLEQTAPGVWMTDESALTCAISAALGRAQARVVCGERKVDVENLLPFATRGLPLQAMGTADLHVELRLAPVRDRYGSKLLQGKALAVPMALHELNIKDPHVSRPLSDILFALSDEVVDVIGDLDRVVIDSRLAQSPDRMDIAATLDFTHAHSWSAQALADSSKRSGPAPQSLFELPRDASMASYVMAQNPRLYESIMHRMTSLIDGALGHVNVNQKLRDEFARNLDQLYSTRTSSGSCAAVPADRDLALQAGKVDALSVFTPWQVCIYDQPLPASVTGSFDAIAKILADPAFRKVIDAKAMTFKRSPAGAGMPAGTIAYEFALDTEAFGKQLSRFAADNKDEPKTKDKAPKAASKPLVGKLYLYVVPDGNRWLMGMGRDLKEVQSHLGAIKNATPQSRIGAIPEVAYLKSTPGVAGGFFTLAYLANSVPKHRSFQVASPADALSTAPHHGVTPIPMIWSVTGDASAPKLELKFRVERPVFEDAVAVGTQYVMKMLR